MTLKRYIPAGTPGATVAEADDANISQVIVAGTGTVTYVADTMDRGTVGVRCYAPLAADTAQIVMTNTSAASVSKQVYFRLNNGVPAVQGHLLGARNSTGNAIMTRLQPNGTIQVLDAGGNNPVTVTPSPALVDDVIYCLELDCTPGASASTGTGRCRIYDNNDNLIGDSGALTGKNYGSANITTLRIGDPDTAIGTGYDITFWGPAINTSATVTDIPFVAKNVNIAPTGSITTAGTATQNDVVQLRGTATDSDGTVASTTWSITSYPNTLAAAPSISNPSSLNTNASFVPLVAGTYGVRLTIVDNLGSSIPINKNIVVELASSVPTSSDLVWSGTAWV